MSVRLPLSLAVLAIATLAGCSSRGEEEAEDNGFVPPTLEARADFADRIEHRFRRFDRDGDGFIDQNEMPGRRKERITVFDTNTDGKVSAAEYRAGELARFDRADTDHDGQISSAERQVAGWADRRR